MKKRLVAVFLAAALVMTNSGFVYAAETENTAAEETQKTEERDLAETDQEPEEEQAHRQSSLLSRKSMRKVYRFKASREILSIR